jgi:hypothetical protein
MKIFARKTSALYTVATKLSRVRLLNLGRPKAMLTDVLCSNCAHAIFDETWGEWKCGKSLARIYDLRKASFCSDYSNKKKEKKK